MKLPQLMYEVMWDTRPFNDKELWGEDGSQPFVYAMGDAYVLFFMASSFNIVVLLHERRELTTTLQDWSWTTWRLRIRLERRLSAKSIECSMPQR